MTTSPLEAPHSPKIKPWHLDRAAVVYVRQSTTPGRPKSGRGSGLAAEDCLVFLKDRFPAYISWERFEANQQKLAANRSRAEAAGAVRSGAALLAGVVWCGRCGRRMYARYARTGQRPSYVCSWQRSDYALPLCQSASADAIEAFLAEQILQALEPAALAASLTAAAEVEQRRREQTRHWEQRLERARFEADRAARQFHACEPENRLVGRTLERRWDEALREVQRLEAEFERFTQTCPRLLGEADREQIRRLAERVRCRRCGTPPAPRQIAASLDQEGFRPPKRSSGFTAGMVRRLLDELGLRPRVPRGTSAGHRLEADERWLHDLAGQWRVSPYTLHGWRKKGWIHARQVGGRGGPWAVWVNEAELARLQELQACPRLWANRERLAELRRPTQRQ